MQMGVTGHTFVSLFKSIHDVAFGLSLNPAYFHTSGRIRPVAARSGYNCWIVCVGKL